jgi:hypothetical protein
MAQRKRHCRTEERTHVKNNPQRNSITHTAATLTRSWHTQAYPMMDRGNHTMPTFVLSRRIYMDSGQPHGDGARDGDLLLESCSLHLQLSAEKVSDQTNDHRICCRLRSLR